MHLRAESHDAVTEPNVKKKVNTIAPSSSNTITINGVNINEYQKRLEALNRKTTPGKLKKNNKKNDKLKKTAPSSDNNRKITSFFNTPPPKEDN